ncbi:diguanylate cyclase (GGDEF domain) with PAS/PAC sensor [Candidatus Burkholderia verschuerenii]|uniref:diguanylate cyclase n=1 Tax=Candidatus Burkholderia verschuerenii TaxID=242163 RepID=A0A0L0MJ64_9BURK|nr:diguanylate cyclase [Candidatus Burkholderia verschuerenii]KND62363.1 diguanylate cyclase (GGDEF domain) with PAS/PAC sensor [Candidatus Burkholderia verschuerenii]
MEQLRQVLSELVIERVGFGIFVLDRDLNVLMWNRFMADHSGKPAEQVIGRSIFASFPELPRVWFTRKVESVFQLGSFAFSSWEQRPYLFKFDHDRPITGGVDYMQQDCTFMPVTHERDVGAVCVTISDVTHASMMQRARDEAVAKLQEFADRDGLTGIANRRYFDHRLGDQFSRWQRYGGELSMLLFDLDHFKRINDQLAHLVGDTVLRVMAERVARTVRVQDVFGRFGGEEFALLLPCTPFDDAMVVAEKVRCVIGETPIDVKGARVPVTASVGVATARRDVTSSYEALINESDAALYTAKREGRNRTVGFA